MKPEFLKNFQVGGQALPQEIVDAILAEAQRDVDAAVKPYADYEAIKGQLKTATEGLEAFKGVDVKDLQGQIAKLQGDLQAQADDHAAQLADLQFQGTLKDAVTAAKGRNVKAILGVLGEEQITALKGSKNQAADIKAALESLKKENGYLFQEDTAPPPYAFGTGTGPVGGGASGLEAIRAAAGLPNK